MKRLTIILIIFIIILTCGLLYFYSKTNKLKEQLELERTERSLNPQTIAGTNIQEIEKFQTLYQEFTDEFNQVKSSISIQTEKITPKDAKPYYDNFLNSRTTANKSEAILFEWREIIESMMVSYNIQPSDWITMSYWNDKGFIIYPANYGASGDKNGHFKHHTTAIVHLAKKDVATANADDWVTIDDQMFNYGDIKPPKIINGQKPN